MRIRRLGLTALVALAWVVPPDVSAQAQAGNASGNSPRMPEFIGQTEPAPDWMVWRAFYQVLHRSSERSPDAVPRDVASRLGITQDKAGLLLDLGRHYVNQGDLMRSGNRISIAGEASRPGVVLPATLPAPAQRRGPTAEELAALARRTPADQLTRPVPTQQGFRSTFDQEGSMARLDETMSRALEDHRRQVVELIGADRHARLAHWIDTEVRDQVQLVRHGARISSPGEVPAGASTRR